LIKAIELYGKAKLEGREISIFPPDFKPNDFLELDKNN
jgi:hypothetical protein